MLQKTTTLGVLGVLAAAVAGAALRGTDARPTVDGGPPGTMAQIAEDGGIDRRVANLDPRDVLGRAAALPAPGGAASPGSRPTIGPVDVAVDEAVRGMVLDGLRVGAGSFARFDGSSGGDVILRVLNGRAAAAITSREPSPGERRRGLGETTLGELVVVLVAHPDNPLGSVSSASVRDLVRGAARDWAPLGGQPGAVRLILPPPGPQAELFARVLARGDTLSTDATFAATDEERLQLVARDPAAVTAVSLEAARRAQVPMLRVDGVPPSLGAVRVGRYPYGAPVLLVHRGAPGAVELSTALQQPAARNMFGHYLSAGGN